MGQHDLWSPHDGVGALLRGSQRAVLLPGEGTRSQLPASQTRTLTRATVAPWPQSSGLQAVRSWSFAADGALSTRADPFSPHIAKFVSLGGV